MAKFFHNKSLILDNMKWATNAFELSNGLMFSSKKRVDRGICLVMPTKEDVKFGASVTMFFCIYGLDILFINTKNKVVDKVTLKPWVPNYTPKKPCKYVIESTIGKFKDIKIGDSVEIIK